MGSTSPLRGNTGTGEASTAGNEEVQSACQDGSPSSASLVMRLERLSANRSVQAGVYMGSLTFFILLVLLPPLSGILLKTSRLTEIYAQPSLMARAQSAIAWSFAIAFLVSTLDLLAGIPLAWFIVRSKTRWVNVIDTLADIPFIIPTAALGFSTLLFWSTPGGAAALLGVDSLISPGVVLILLLHFAFSFPAVVRVMVGALLGYEATYEVAAKTLGAQPFTAARTVTLPILRPAVVASFLLAFARSLSETGATVMVAGAFENGPVFIKNAKDAGLEGPLVFVSFILIFASVLAFGLISLVGPRLKIPVRRASPRAERALSGRTGVAFRDIVTMLVFFIFVITPSLFIALPAGSALTDGTLQKALSGSGPWGPYWQSVLLSYTIGVIATLVNIAAGLPVAVILARRRAGKVPTALLDALVNIPIVVPSIALGVSLSFFWNTFGGLPEFWVLVLSHTTITYTYFVRSMSAAIEGISPEMEETARSLGARPLTVFRKITVPLSKYAALSGAILVFTRSVDETGAAIAVSRELKTAPVLLVEWVKGTVPVSASERALGVGLLALTSFIALLVLRLVTRRRR